MITPQYIRAMGIFEIFRSAFELYRRNFRQFFLINVTLIVANLGFGFLTTLSLYNQNPRSIDLLSPCFRLLLQFIFLTAVYLVAAAMFVAASNAVLGRSISVRHAYRRVLSTRSVERFFLASLLVGIIVVVGFILFIIPGIIFLVWLTFVPIIVALEPLGVRAALGRSRKLVQGYFWHVLLALACYAVPISILSVATAGIIKIAAGINPYNLLPSTLVNLTVSSVIGLLIGPLGWLVLSLLYYDVRARKENYNEELLAVEVGDKLLSETR